MKQQIERRFLKGGSLQARAKDEARADGKPGITGIGAVYNQPYDNGWFIEQMKPGAFTRAITEPQDVRSLFNHNPDNLLGRTKSGTLRITDTATGLQFDCDTDPNSHLATDVQAMIARKDLDGCSISFVVRRDSWSDEFDKDGNYVQSTRTIEDVDLYDVGPVTFPAYTQTSVDTRSLWPSGIPDEIRSHVPSLKAEAGKSGTVPPGDKRAAAHRDDTACTCECDPCQNGNCADCNCAEGDDCESTTCGADSCMCSQDRARMRMRMRLAEASL